ncbi:MAG: hypothetical protein KI791_06685 [Cyclobacteriaceae bacterium]|nr:hypothetical protein [Cyclobacteriaceae bacterium SS2]
MISAIFEILGLLTVSCLIGIYFTYRYWTDRFRQLKDENLVLNKHINGMVSQIDVLKSKINELETALKLATEHVIEDEKIVAKRLTKASPDKSKELRKEIVVLKEEKAEMEREIEVLSKELDARKISYYKYIDGRRYKGITIKMADAAVSGKGDGRISMEDAEKIFDTISDGKAYTQVEKDTLRRLRTHYNWTEQADELFRKKVRSWAAKGHVLD